MKDRTAQYLERVSESRVGHLVVLSPLMLAACFQPTELVETPSEATIDLIERRLVENECIGSMNRWQRSYYFPVRENRAIRRYVIFSFKEAGVYGRRPGRVIGRSGGRSYLDERPSLMAWGVYDIMERSIQLNYCGQLT